MIRANRFARIALRIARATKFDSVFNLLGQAPEGPGNSFFNSIVTIASPIYRKSPKSLKKVLPGLPARSVKKVSKKSPNTDFVVFLTHFRVIWDFFDTFFVKIKASMWPHVAQVKRVFSVRGHEHSQKSDHHLPSLHHLSKSDFRHHLILPVLILLSSLDLCFHSSLVIVIVKSYSDI